MLTRIEMGENFHPYIYTFYSFPPCARDLIRTEMNKTWRNLLGTYASDAAWLINPTGWRGLGTGRFPSAQAGSPLHGCVGWCSVGKHKAEVHSGWDRDQQALQGEEVQRGLAHPSWHLHTFPSSTFVSGGCYLIFAYQLKKIENLSKIIILFYTNY